MKTNKRKKIIFYTWIILVIGILAFRLLNPQFFEAQNLKLLFSNHLALALTTYFILGIIRGLTLIPLTPLLIAGILVFDPIPLLLITILGVIISSSIVYYWSRFLGFDIYFNEEYPKQLEKIKHYLRKKELPFIILWAFFPLVPTDVICYACEILRIKLWKCLLGVTIGEGIICAIYIFGIKLI